jgi:hypothetical protein
MPKGEERPSGSSRRMVREMMMVLENGQAPRRGRNRRGANRGLEVASRIAIGGQRAAGAVSWQFATMRRRHHPFASRDHVAVCPAQYRSQPGSKLSRGELYLLGDGTNALSSCDDPDIGYLIGVGITLAPTIRSTPATYLAASIGWEMPTLLRGRQGSSATPQLRTILPFRDLGLLRVNPAVPASCPGFVLATSGSDQTAGGINGGVCRRRAYKAYFWQAGPARGWLSWIAGPIGRAISRLRRRRAVRRNRYK